MRGSIAGVVMFAAVASGAAAQNPIQWSGNPQAAIARAKEQQLPLMFWVSDRRDIGDDDALRDAEEDSFRDPSVVAVASRRFVPVRVSRNSRVQGEAERLGLPTTHGMYIAVMSPSGDLLDTITPMEVADPTILAERLIGSYRRYRDELYERDLAPVIRDLQKPKPAVRDAVRTAWRLGVLAADKDVAGLLQRPDLTPQERSRIYSMLAALATQASVDALLKAAAEGDKTAGAALRRAEAGAIEFLLTELPGAEGTPSARQLAAYEAAASLSRLPSARPASFWEKAPVADRTRELDLLRRRAEPVLAYWAEREGAWR